MTRSAAGSWHVRDMNPAKTQMPNLSAWSSVGPAVLGGSVGASAAPIVLEEEAEGYVYFPGSSSNGAWIASGGWQQSGDLDVQVEVDSTDWQTSNPNAYFLSRAFSGSRQFQFGHRNSRLLRFVGAPSTGDGSGVAVDSDAAVPAAFVGWVRALWSPTAQTVQFFTSADDRASWQQLGTTRTLTLDGGVPVLSDPSIRLLVGGRAGGQDIAGAENIAGKIYRFDVFDGSGLVFRWDSEIAQQNGWTLATGQAVTVTRSAAGRKTAVVNRAQGGSIHLYGSNRYSEVADHPDLNFGTGEEFTAAALFRDFGTPSSNWAIIAKRTNIGLANPDLKGWFLRRLNGGRTAFAGAANGSIVSGSGAVSVGASGDSVVVAAVRDGASDLIARSATGDSTKTPLAGDLVTTSPMRIGRQSGGGLDYADMEYTASAVFRRALTPAELARFRWEAETRRRFNY